MCIIDGGKQRIFLMIDVRHRHYVIYLMPAATKNNKIKKISAYFALASNAIHEYGQYRDAATTAASSHRINKIVEPQMIYATPKARGT